VRGQEGGIYAHGSIRVIVCVFGRRPRFVLGWRIFFPCRWRSLQSLVDGLGFLPLFLCLTLVVIVVVVLVGGVIVVVLFVVEPINIRRVYQCDCLQILVKSGFFRLYITNDEAVSPIAEIIYTGGFCNQLKYY
jgi:Na+-transporting NADH:ubiquinone oxidoreductase subunit NqrD